VEEYQKYIADDDAKKTVVEYNASFISSLGLFARPVERFSFNKYAEGGAKARKGMSFILDKLHKHGDRL
jgi:hypothetical protein